MSVTGLHYEPEVLFALVLNAIESQIVLELELMQLEVLTELDAAIVLVVGLHFVLGLQIGEHELLAVRLQCKVEVLQLPPSLCVAAERNRDCMAMACNGLFLR